MNLEYTVLGFKFNIVNLFLFFFIGFLVALLTICSCSKVKSVKEAFDMIKKNGGDPSSPEEQHKRRNKEKNKTNELTKNNN